MPISDKKSAKLRCRLTISENHAQAETTAEVVAKAFSAADPDDQAVGGAFHAA
jgi:hypothetical protein